MNINISSSNNTMRMPARNDTRTGRIDRLTDMRARLREREDAQRKREDARIQRLGERMNTQLQNPELTAEMRTQIIRGFNMQIEQIYRNRADREAEAAEKEAAIMQMILEENTRPEQREEQEESRYESDEEAKERIERERLTGLTQIAISQDRITALRQTRAAMANEAGHLRAAMDSDVASMAKVGVVPRGDSVEVITSFNPIRGNDNFVNNQYNKLREGISRLDASIMHATATMYQQSASAQEAYLAENKQDDDDEK